MPLLRGRPRKIVAATGATGAAGACGGGPPARCYCFSLRRDGERCSALAVADDGCGGPLCAVHLRRIDYDPVLRLIRDCVGHERSLFSLRDVYATCSAYWSREPTTTDPFTLLKDTLIAVFSANRFKCLADDAGIARGVLTNVTTKYDIADRLLAAAYRMWQFAERPGAISALSALQRRWRERQAERRLNKRGPWPRVPAQNDADPFTLDDLADIPAEDVFSYRDQHGSVYAFRATHLAHYAFNNPTTSGPPKNPYTRDVIPEADVDRLHELVYGRPRNGPEAAAGAPAVGADIGPMGEDLTALWRTPRDAYSYTLYFFEREGFYCDVDLFLRLTSDEIVRIFHFFHENTQGVVSPNSLMSIEACYAAVPEAVHNPGAMAFAFCRQLLGLIRSTRGDKFFLLCNLFMALAVVNRRIGRSMPRWVLLGAARLPQPPPGARRGRPVRA